MTRALVEHAIERFGEGRVDDLLDDTTNRRSDLIGRAGIGRRRQRPGENQHVPHRETMRAITVSEILSAAESSDSRFSLFRGWGMYADEADLGDGPPASLGPHGSRRSSPTCSKCSRTVRPRSSTPASSNCVGTVTPKCDAGRSSHWRRSNTRSIREFALAELEKGVRDGSVVGLFVRNYRRGDEHRILESIEFPDDDCERHWLLMDVIKVLEANPDADCSRLGIIAYASTPCENCRSTRPACSDRQHVAPGWLIEECRFDSSEESRELVAEITGPPQAESE